MEEEANQLYRRPEMTGQARDEEDWHTLYIMETYFFNFIVCVFIGGSTLVKKTSIDTAVPSVLRSWTQGPSPAAASRVIYVFFKCWV